MMRRALRIALSVVLCAMIFLVMTYSALYTDVSDPEISPTVDQEISPAPIVPENPSLPEDNGNTDTLPDNESSPVPPSDGNREDDEATFPENGCIESSPGTTPPDEELPEQEDSDPSVSLPTPPASDDNPTESDKNYIEQFTSIAYGELGTKEKKYNNVKYNTWYYGRPVSATSSSSSTYAWCIAFISWCANNADIPTDVIPKMNSASRLCAFYKEAGLFETRKQHTPAAGDIIFFGKKNANHAGIVIAVTDTTVTVIEGNSSDKVSKLTYSLSNSSILGYASPDYAGI